MELTSPLIGTIPDDPAAGRRWLAGYHPALALDGDSVGMLRAPPVCW